MAYYPGNEYQESIIIVVFAPYVSIDLNQSKKVMLIVRRADSPP